MDETILKKNSRALTGSLQADFGFLEFRPGQEEAIQSLLDEEHTLVVMPTGAGKSLVYQFTALHSSGTTLVLSPLIALMKDQVDHLTRHNIPATYINSTLSPAEQSQRLQAMIAGRYRLVYVAPERLRSVPFLNAIQNLNISLLAVDEAHCLSEWGHDFRPDYLHIAEARRGMAGPLTVALTATATPRVQDDITRLLKIPHMRRIVTGFNRPNLAFMVRYTYNLASKLRTLRELFSEESQFQDGAAIIYAGTRRDAEEVADFLHEVVKIPVEYYHAGLANEERTRIQNAFLSGNLQVIAATNAFGMGIDRPDVRQVVHYAIPSSLEAYYQEAGRAGRDGKPAQVTLLYASDDRALQEWFIENSAPTAAELRTLYDTLTSTGSDTLWRSIENLSLTTGLPEVKIKVIISHLEKAGALAHLGDEGTRMLLRPGAWNPKAIASIMASTEIHRRYKEAQLKKMIGYAEADTCRREIILKHFGDNAPLKAPRCCDNCLAEEKPLPETPSTLLSTEEARVPLVILDAVRRLDWGVGQTKLAQMLAGSRGKAIREAGYTKNIYYGRLEAFTQTEIRNLIEQLIRQGYFKVIGGEYPSLRLTQRGRQALTAKTTIPLNFPDANKLQHRRAKRQAGGTVGLTAQLFAQRLHPTEIAAQRDLKLSTILTHAAKLIEEEKLALDKVVPPETTAKIRAVIESLDKITGLSPIKNRLPENISFGQIKCVLADWERGEDRPPRAKTPLPSSVPAVILACVEALPGQLPRSGVAKVLVGSDSERVAEFRGDPFFGHLSDHNRLEVTRIIDDLLEQGKLALEENKVIPGVVEAEVPIRGEITALKPPATKRTERVYQLGESRSPEAVPELAAALRDSNGNVRRLAASALGKIAVAQAVEPLIELLSREDKPQVRQYAIKALGQIGDPRPRKLLEKIAADTNELGYTQEAARLVLKDLSLKSRAMPIPIPEDDPIAAYLSHPHPRPLPGPWEVGLALEFHSRFSGSAWSRSPVGELVYRLKYQQDQNALEPLVARALAVCQEHPQLAQMEAVLSVPPSESRTFDPVSAFAKALASRLDTPFRPVLVKTRQTNPQKELRTLAQKRANVAGAFAVRGQLEAKNLLVVDDLYDSGATLEEVTRILQQVGARKICVLTWTRTIHADG